MIPQSCLHLLTLALGLTLASCVQTKSKQVPDYDPMVVDYPEDGGYNPYPGGRGSAPAYEPPPDLSNLAQEQVPEPQESVASRSKSSASSARTSPSKTTASNSRSTTGGSKPRSTAGSKSTRSSGRTHTVVKGDSLSRIASRNKTTVAKLKAANGLKSDLIRPGQKLRLP